MNCQFHGNHCTLPVMLLSVTNLTASAMRNGSAAADPHQQEQYTAFLAQSRFLTQHIIIPVVCIVGIIVNCMTVVIFSQRRLRSSTNMYLKALAAFDLIYLGSVLALSIKHHKYYHPNYLYYLPYGYFLTDFASNTSVWLTAAFTIERFLVVGNPMHHLKYANARCAQRVVLIIAIICFFATFSTFFESEVVHVVINNSTNETRLELCATELGQSKVYKNFIYWFTSIVFVFIPFLLIATLNVFLIRSLRAARAIRSSLSPAILASELRTTLLLVVIILMFLLCQGPTAIMMIVSVTVPERTVPENLFLGMNNILNLLVAINACANFFLYVGLSVKFRRTFLSLLFSRVNRKLVSRSIRTPNGYNLANTPYG